MPQHLSVLDRVNFRLARVRHKNDRACVLTEPVISFSFDDFPKSAVEIGATKLEEAGFRGTFYAAATFFGAKEDGQDYFTASDLQRLEDAGHEIGCHTFDHANLMELSNAEIRAQFSRNQTFFGELRGGERFNSFAYPFGNVSPKVKKETQKHYPICRGVWSGLNVGTIDMALLSTIGLDHSLTQEQLDDWISRAITENGWLTFTAHDIRDDHSPHGISPAHYASVVETVAKSGIKVLPICEAAALAVGDPSLTPEMNASSEGGSKSAAA